MKSISQKNIKAVTLYFYIFLTFFLFLLFPLFSTTAQEREEPHPSPEIGETTSVFVSTPPPSVPTERISLKINLPATRIDFYINDKLEKSYPVAIGMPKYPTPIRDFNISQIIWNPWWIPPPDREWAENEKETPPGPKNPLGPVKMIMQDGVRIHGTIAPQSIGRAASHACIRMRSSNAVELAWEIQKRYSNKTEEKYLESYKKQRDKSFYVRLIEEIPVSVEYKLVETKGDKIVIYPDRYEKGGLKEELTEALSKWPEIEVSNKLLNKIKKMKNVKGIIELDLTELQSLQSSPDSNLNPRPTKNVSLKNF